MKRIFFIFLFVVSISCYSMQKIQLPEKNILDDRLSDLNLEYFNEKAHVARNLAQLECTPLHFLTLFDQMLEDFRVFCKNDEFANYNWIDTIKKNKAKILTSLLKEHPQAIRFLQKNNLISSDE